MEFRRPVILYRTPPDLDFAEESAIQRHLPMIHIRTRVQSGDLVIGRYSVLPYYSELALDVRYLGGELVNSYSQHRYIADLKNWVEDLYDMTPRTWGRLEDLPEKGPFILKGETNSRKDKWLTHMYAETKADAVQVWLRLKDDPLFADQQIYIREFVPLKKLHTGINGMPVSEEYRFFVLDGKVLTGAFYWSSHTADLKTVPSADAVPEAFLTKALAAIGNYATFYVIDVARTESGQWIVVELNDGQMSGLSENDPDKLYAAIAQRFVT